ncbi:MAG: CHAT domain-containing protein [Treponema sp.]|jgi:tetratricopeptide (TPR) repeat protein/CHAT domain-containing protein|nr:CHAT domain-containing protein [Treponema sp.]
MSPNDLQARMFFIKGTEFGSKGQYSKALYYSYKALEFKPDFAVAYGNIGNAYSYLGDQDRAIEAFNKAISLSKQHKGPEDFMLYGNRGLSYYYKREISKAISDFEYALTLNPKDDYVYVSLGNAYTYMGDYNRAIENYLKAISLNDKYTEAYNSLGSVYFHMDNYKNAITAFKAALNLNKNYPMYKCNLANAFAYSGDRDSALNLFNEIIDEASSYYLAYSGRSKIYFDMAKGTEDEELIRNYHRNALADLTRAIELNPLDFKVWRDRGLAYKAIGEYAKALKDISRSIKRGPGISRNHFERGDTYERIHDYEKALADYQDSIQTAKESNTTVVLVNRTWSFVLKIYQQGKLDKENFSDPFYCKLYELTKDALGCGISKTEQLRKDSRGKQIMLNYLYLYYVGVDMETSAGNSEKAFGYSESLRGRNILEQIGVAIALDPCKVTEDERKEVLRLTNERDFSQNVINEYLGRNYSFVENNRDKENRFLYACENLNKIEKELKELHEEIDSRIPGYLEKINPRPIDIAEAKKFCGNDTVVLEYVLWDQSALKDYAATWKWVREQSESHSYEIPESIIHPCINSYCFVLSNDGVTAIPLNFKYIYEDDRLEQEIKGILDLIAKEDKGTRFEEYCGNLYAELIKPVFDRKLIGGNVKNIIVVPDGSLPFLPFDILQEDAQSPQLGKQYKISFSPSVTISAKRKDWKPEDESIIAFGDIEYNNTHDENADRRTTRLIAKPDPNDPNTNPEEIIPNLPWTKIEIDNLERIALREGKRINIYRGSEASETMVKELSRNGELEKYSIVHFSGHGHYDKENVDKWGIVLSEASGPGAKEDGYLSIEDIAQVRLKAEMVELSICNAGLGEYIRGSGFVGLPISFMTAGAKSVGVSLWALDDKATSAFIVSLYTKVLQKHKTFRDAYYEVKNEFREGTIEVYGDEGKKIEIEDEEKEKWKHPMYWAGLILYE